MGVHKCFCLSGHLLCFILFLGGDDLGESLVVCWGSPFFRFLIPPPPAPTGLLHAWLIDLSLSLKTWRLTTQVSHFCFFLVLCKPKVQRNCFAFFFVKVHWNLIYLIFNAFFALKLNDTFFCFVLIPILFESVLDPGSIFKDPCGDGSWLSE